MNTYRLTPDDLNYVKQKMSRQKKYLQDSTFITGQGQVKSLLDVSFSANHSVRYYAQLANKINTMTDYSKSIGHVPIFLTMTLDGYYRDFLRGDFKRFKNLPDDKKKLALRGIPNNDIYGYLKDKIKDNIAFTVKDLYNCLNTQTKNFFMSYSVLKLKKSGVRYDYVKAIEPHKDGVPHLHMLLFVPMEYKDSLKKDFEKCFPAPENKKPLIINKFTKETCPEGQTKGFQWIIHNPAGYVMKYVTKSFRDVKNNAEIDYLQAWYIKHRITRVTFSKSTIPQWVYQKMVPLEKDWFHLTELLRTDTGRCEWSKEEDYILLHDNDFNRTLEYDRGLYKIFYGDKIVREFGEIKEKVVIDKYDPMPTQWNKHGQNIHNYIDVYIDFDKYALRNGELIKNPKKPFKMTNLELYSYFNSLDLDTVDIQHYGLTRNMMINKGLLNGELINPSEYKDTFDNDLQDYLISVPQGVNLGDYLEAGEVF